SSAPSFSGICENDSLALRPIALSWSTIYRTPWHPFHIGRSATFLETYNKGAFITPEDQGRAGDIDAEADTDRRTTQANLEKERPAALIALAAAVRHFRRVWPEGTDDTVANIMPSLDRTDRRRLIAFLRACRDLDIEV